MMTTQTRSKRPRRASKAHGQELMARLLAALAWGMEIAAELRQLDPEDYPYDLNDINSERDLCGLHWSLETIEALFGCASMPDTHQRAWKIRAAIAQAIG